VETPEIDVHLVAQPVGSRNRQVMQWHVVLARVANHESYRTIAKDYGVSRETIRRLVQDSKKAS